MWTQTICLLLFSILVHCSTDVTIKIDDFKMVDADGEQCAKDSDSGVTTCTVKGGRVARMTGEWTFAGTVGNTITELKCSVSYQGLGVTKKNANVCQRRDKGNIVFNGSPMQTCSWDAISQGTFEQDVYKTMVPDKPGTRKMTMTCDATWSDKSKTCKLEVASLIAVIT